MMKWGTHRIYDTLHSGTNEYNEIVMQRFSTSDNHQELGDNLSSLHLLGLNPFLTFSDDPLRDETLLKKMFRNLRNDDNDIVMEEEIPVELIEMTSDKKILYLFRLQDALDTLSQFRYDIEAALDNVSHNSVKICFDTEWPVYFDGNGSNHRKTNGNINIVQLASNVTDYTIILELYNFKDNEHHIRAIGQKLKAIFSLKVHCFTGCHQKSDYTMLQNQYRHFDFPKEAYNIMDDVSIMAVNRGLTKRGKGKATLQALCRVEGRYLRKPEHVRLGTCFNSMKGSLAQEALKYCQLDVETPLILHSIYIDKPDLTKRIKKTDVLQIGSTVDVMPSGTSTETIAQGKIKQVGPSTWGRNNKMKVGKNQVLIEIDKVFNPRGVIHYPCTSETSTKCDCGRQVHGAINDDCNFYLYSQYGKPPFLVLELKSRLREMNELIIYPEPTSYDADNNEQDDDMHIPTNQDTTLLEDDEFGEDSSIMSDNTSNDDDNNNNQFSITSEALEILLASQEYDDGYDSDTNSDHGEEYQPTELEERVATDVSFNATLDKIIEDADRLAQWNEENELVAVQQHDDGLQIDELPANLRYKSVLGDIFHFMDRAKLPMHHEYKALFFRALRASVFIMCKQDVEDVKTVLEAKRISWEKKMAFDWNYIAHRVRRHVPKPEVLYHRMTAVYEFFCDKIDTTTGVKLFNDKNKKKFKNMLDTVKRGYASDPPHMSMYIQKTDRYGRPMADDDGLMLYRSLRGTSNLESLHQYLTTSFGHTIAGPWYSDCLLSVVRHNYNWRMSRKNRPYFPQIMHYEGEMIDRINTLYESLYGYSKYRDWKSFNECLPLVSAYGIVGVDSTHSALLQSQNNESDLFSSNKMLKYLSTRQKSIVPFLPIRGVNEKRLVHQKLNALVANQDSLTNHTVFEEMSKFWNKNDVCVQQIFFPKLACHFIKYVKLWRKNQDRRDAEISSGANRINRALEHVPDGNVMPNFDPVPLAYEQPNLDEPTELPPTEQILPALGLLCSVCNTRQAEQPAPKRKKR